MTLWLVFWLTFNPIAVRMVVAQEVIEEPTAQTGDAISEVVSDVVANVDIEVIPAESPHPSGEPSSAPIVIENENTGEVVVEVMSEAVSGESQIVNDEDVSALTGNAQAIGEVGNAVNVDVVEGNPAEGQSLEIVNKNDGDLTNTVVVEAVTGNSQIVSSGFAQLETGDAVALLNLINLLNLNFVNSGFKVLTLDDLNELGKTLDLNALWDELQQQLGVTGEETSIENTNDGVLTNDAVVKAVSGNNTVVGGEGGAMTTGDSTALGNIFNLVNANLVDSRLLFAFVNLIGSGSSDLILPNPEKFVAENGTGGGVTETTSDNTATVTDTLGVEAVSSGTGDAASAANNITMANLDLYYTSHFFFLINNLGGWTGKVLNWGTPGSIFTQDEVTHLYSLTSVGVGGGVGPSITNDNQAQTGTNLEVAAVSGNNSGVQTGSSRAAGNIFNLVNANLFKSHLFVGFLNISNWGGNVVFAYPDVEVSLGTNESQKKPGETFTYYVTANNKGQDEARGVTVKLSLPDEIKALGETVWSLGPLGAGESRTVEVQAQIQSDFSFEEKVSFWQRVGIIKEASAATPEKSRTVRAEATVFSLDSESNTFNNTASVDMKVYVPADDSDGIDHRQPALEISSANNVADFVYSGDTVTFNVTVKNTSDTPSYETRLIQKLVGNGVDMVVAEFPLGTIPAGQGGTLSFGFQLPRNGIPAGAYFTVAQAYGKANDGTGISSNESRTDFKLKVRFSAGVTEVLAAEDGEEVLGAETVVRSCPQDQANVWPYLMLLVLSTYILSRIWRGKTRWENGVNKIVITVGMAIVLALSFYKIFIFVKPKLFNVQAQTCEPCPSTCPTWPPRPSPTIVPSPTPTPEVTPSPSPEDSPLGTPVPTNSSGTGGPGGGDPGPSVCTDTTPNVPYLKTAMSVGGNSVKLTWEKVTGASTGYSIFYGPTCDNFLYSVVDTGNVDNYTVNGLTSGCFQIRAKNGCAIGDPSNNVSTGSDSGTGGQVLGASTLAGTGVFEDAIMNVVFTLGSIFTALSIRKKCVLKLG